MLNILYIYGTKDSDFEINPSNLAGDLGTVRASTAIQALKGGRLATIGADGYVKLAVDGDSKAGFIINDAAGYEFENAPAIASGKLTLLVAGGLVETDQVVEDNIKAGDKLYIGTGGNAGLLTKVDPTAGKTGTVFAIARGTNSASNKTVKVQF